MSSIQDLITTVYRQYYITQCVHFSSLTFLLWDYIVTFTDEVELFWTGKWSYPRVLFFVNRYQAIGWQMVHTVGVLTVTKPGFERVGHVWMHNMIIISAVSGIIPIQLILSFRVYGLYNRAKWIIGFFAVAILATTAAQLYLVIKFSPAVTQISIPFLKISACQPTPGTTSHLFIAPIPALVFDVPAFLLVLLRGVSHLRAQRNIGFRGAALIRLLVRDSIQYFLIIVVAYSGSIIAFIKLPDIETFATFTYTASIISVSGSRMLINLRKG
ncbi:hypothetical protein AB1N83_003534 [Pleurotus pulmonarius]